MESFLKYLLKEKESSRALWKLPELSQFNNGGVGSLNARFQFTNGPGSQRKIRANFNCEGTTLSGVDFQLMGPGYRLSMTQKRFYSGIKKVKRHQKLRNSIDFNLTCCSYI